MTNAESNIKIYSFEEIQKLPKLWITPKVGLPDFGIEVLCCVAGEDISVKDGERRRIIILCRHSIGNCDDYIWDDEGLNGAKKFNESIIGWRPQPDFYEPEKRHSLKSIDMKKFGFSNVGNLGAMVRELEHVFKKYFPNLAPSFAIAFTLHPNLEVHWASNIPRDIGIQILREVADKMERKSN